MQQDDVVGAFADGMVELDVDLRFVVEIGAAVRRLHARHDAVEQRQVVGGRAPGGIFGRQPSISRRYSR